LNHGNGKILAANFYSDTECANLSLKQATYDDLHNKLGHPHKQAVLDTARYCGIKVLEPPTPTHVCSECAFSKIRVKNLGNNDTDEAVMLGERIFIDISSIKQVSYGGSKFWLLVQDKFTDYLWSFFLSSKSEQTDVLLDWIASFQKQYDTTIQTI
jgi:hypothetical protein